MNVCTGQVDIQASLLTRDEEKASQVNSSWEAFLFFKEYEWEKKSQKGKCSQSIIVVKFQEDPVTAAGEATRGIPQKSA